MVTIEVYEKKKKKKKKTSKTWLTIWIFVYIHVPESALSEKKAALFSPIRKRADLSDDV